MLKKTAFHFHHQDKKEWRFYVAYWGLWARGKALLLAEGETRRSVGASATKCTSMFVLDIIGTEHVYLNAYLGEGLL